MDEEYRWCLVGNFVDSYFPNDGKFTFGNRHFTPGTKLYMAPAAWGDGYEQIVVIGKHRASKKYVEIIMPLVLIHNFRVQKIYKPAVLKRMESSDFRWWKQGEAGLMEAYKYYESLHRVDFESRGLKHKLLSEDEFKYLEDKLGLAEEEVQRILKSGKDFAIGEYDDLIIKLILQSDDPIANRILKKL